MCLAKLNQIERRYTRGRDPCFSSCRGRIMLGFQDATLLHRGVELQYSFPSLSVLFLQQFKSLMEFLEKYNRKKECSCSSCNLYDPLELYLSHDLDFPSHHKQATIKSGDLIADGDHMLL